MARTAIFSVIFPANHQYFRSFLASLRRQSDQNFDLLLLVDSVDSIEDDIAAFDKGIDRGWRIERFNTTGTIVSIREEAFKWIRTLGYDAIIFADTDDLMHPDRVAVCRANLDAYPIVVSDIVPFSDEDKIGTEGYWKPRMAEGFEFGREAIQLHNFAGLGNTAVRREVIDAIRIPQSVTAVDWFVFFHWLRGRRGVFTHHGQVLYRQHEANTIGAGGLSEERLIKVVDTKIAHFQSLLPLHQEFETELDKHKRLDMKLRDGDFRREAVSYLNARQLNYFWWEETEYLNE